jgi:hypothetical protein
MNRRAARLFPHAIAVLATVACVMGCSTTGADPGLAARAPSSVVLGMPAGSTAKEHETRYYADEKGILWDDRGHRKDEKP